MKSKVEWFNLNSLSLPELKSLCDQYGIAVDGKMTKARHINLLEDYRDTVLKISNTNQPKGQESPPSRSHNSSFPTPLSSQQTPQKVTQPVSTPVVVDTPTIAEVRELSPQINLRKSTSVPTRKETKQLNQIKFYLTLGLFFLSLSVTLYLYFRS